MRYEFIDPIVSSTLRIMTGSIPGTERRGEAAMLRADQITGDVRVTIGISGDSQGDLIITMTSSTAREICSVILQRKMSALEAEALDALAELGNVIAGNSVSALNDLGFDFSMVPPRVSTAGTTETYSPETEVMQIPLASRCGDIDMHVLLSAD